MISSNSEWALSVADNLSPAAELLVVPPLTSSSTVSRAEKLAIPRLVLQPVLNFLGGGSITSLSRAGGGGSGGGGDGAGAGAGGTAGAAGGIT